MGCRARIPAADAGLDVPAFRSALDRHTYTAVVEAERAAAIELGIQATPTLIINDRVVPVLPAKAGAS